MPNEFILNRNVFERNDKRLTTREAAIKKCHYAADSLAWAREKHVFSYTRSCDLSRCLGGRLTVAAYAVLDDSAQPVAKNVYRRRIWYVTASDRARQKNGLPPADAVKFSTIQPNLESEPAEWTRERAA